MSSVETKIDQAKTLVLKELGINLDKDDGAIGALEREIKEVVQEEEEDEDEDEYNTTEVKGRFEEDDSSRHEFLSNQQNYMSHGSHEKPHSH